MRFSIRIAAVVLLLSTVDAAQGNPLRLPTFIADIRGYTPFGPVSFYKESINPFSHSELLLPGAIYSVLLEAQGKGESWQAIADPVFTIDPNATFMLDGENVSFADAYFLEYSEGLIPEPSTISLLAVCLCSWIVVRRRTIQKSVQG